MVIIHRNSKKTFELVDRSEQGCQTRSKSQGCTVYSPTIGYFSKIFFPPGTVKIYPFLSFFHLFPLIFTFFKINHNIFSPANQYHIIWPPAHPSPREDGKMKNIHPCQTLIGNPGSESEKKRPDPESFRCSALRYQGRLYLYTLP